jgi:tubulin polyglutamylase TTLL5
MRSGEMNYWILKPIGKSRGRGITLVNDISQVIYAESIIAQKYMKNPMLYKGFKFDLRIYALVTNMNPLELFIYKEGMFYKFRFRSYIIRTLQFGSI